MRPVLTECRRAIAMTNRKKGYIRQRKKKLHRQVKKLDQGIDPNQNFKIHSTETKKKSQGKSTKEQPDNIIKDFTAIVPRRLYFMAWLTYAELCKAPT